MNTALLLRGPFGWDSYDGACISLLAPGAFDADQLERVLLRYSCHSPAIPTIKSCLHFSGRYDCILQASWFRNQKHEVTLALREIGVTLIHHGYLVDAR